MQRTKDEQRKMIREILAESKGILKQDEVAPIEKRRTRYDFMLKNKGRAMDALVVQLRGLEEEIQERQEQAGMLVIMVTLRMVGLDEEIFLEELEKQLTTSS